MEALAKEMPLRIPVEQVLLANKHVPFVQRILDPKAPFRKNPDGTVSTHLMADAEVDGRHIAYPTLRRIEGRWVEDPNPTSAMMAGDFIEFSTAAGASEFARGSWKTARGPRANRQ